MAVETLFPSDFATVRAAALALAYGLLAGVPAQGAAPEQMADLSTLSIEELGNIEISSVTKTAEPLSQSPAAVYVITGNDIARAGAARLPEMLRLAPNLQVAQIAAYQHAVTARGFNSAAADKLLVLVDGRTVYAPAFSGVYWDLQDVPAESIARIEVVSGPGGTLWGANAVNGVINVITHEASETPGTVLHLGGGNREKRGSLQFGGSASDTLAYRTYLSGFVHDGESLTGSGADGEDGWHKVQGGFRADWTPGANLVTVQGDLYRGAEDQLALGDQKIAGENILARWSRDMAGGSLQLQAYYDRFYAMIPDFATNEVRTYDLDVQHSFALGARQEIVWGGGYRVMSDNFPTVINATQQVAFIPQRRTLNLGNVFVQDTVRLTDDLRVIAGVKLEDQPYTGVTALPSVRAAWTPADSNLLWAAVSRAVRVPSRLDRDVTQVTDSTVTIAGGDMQTVKVIAYEAGYRVQIADRASFSASAFFNDYQDLRSAEFTRGGYPIVFANGMEGETYGVELWGNYQVTDWWRLTAGFNWLHKDLRFKAGSSGLGGLQIAGNDPKTQISVRSAMNITDDLTFDLDARRIGALPAPASPAYAELSLRLAWKLTATGEIALTGANLLHKYHAEFGTTANTLQTGRVGVRVPRSVFLDTRWRF